MYPPTGTGAVNITRGDLKRLDEGQYLNDTMIEFGLKCAPPCTWSYVLADVCDRLWLDDVRKTHPEIADQVHEEVTETIEIENRFHRTLIGQGGQGLRDLIARCGGPADSKAQAGLIRLYVPLYYMRAESVIDIRSF